MSLSTQLVGSPASVINPSPYSGTVVSSVVGADRVCVATLPFNLQLGGKMWWLSDTGGTTLAVSGNVATWTTAGAGAAVTVQFQSAPPGISLTVARTLGASAGAGGLAVTQQVYGLTPQSSVFAQLRSVAAPPVATNTTINGSTVAATPGTVCGANTLTINMTKTADAPVQDLIFTVY